jgi:alkanesulfonate monooxygenase SsuD/methylene tetrahydromethanopterin reductase-like flavin-dependent oxidoreductase (luciferase family)
MQLGFCPIQGDYHYEEAIEEVRYADEQGLDSVFLQEHHEAEVNQYWSDPMSVLTAFATETESIELGTAILLLPLYNPVRLAERGAILDGISDGRFTLGAAIGYRPREFEIMDVPRSERGAMYEEYLTLVSRCWSEESVTFEGDYYEVEEFRCTPHPAGDSRPTVWIGGYHDVVLDRTARFVADGLADAWFPGTQPHREGLADRRERFEGMLADRDIPAEDVSQPLFRDGIIAETREEAYDLAVEYLVEGYEKQYEGRGHEPSEQGDLGHDVLRGEYDPEDLIEDRFLVGDPDDWVKELEAYEDALGADHVVVRVYFEGMDHGDIMDQLELICEEVKPQL